MSQHRFPAVLAALGFFVLLAAPASAQDRRQNEAGNFDYYVLSLSWSPSFCEAASERGNTGRATREQCGERPYSFVVHGLWPQYEKGFPEYCKVPAPRLDRNIMTSMLDMMPSPRLVYHQWDKHGTCSGLSPRAYFETIRKARATLKIPEEFLDLKTTRVVKPAEVEEAFVKANDGMAPNAIAVNCDSKRLSEIRICMTRDFKFRDCGAVEHRACRRDTVVMPPVRGG